MILLQTVTAAAAAMELGDDEQDDNQPQEQSQDLATWHDAVIYTFL